MASAADDALGADPDEGYLPPPVAAAAAGLRGERPPLGSARWEPVARVLRSRRGGLEQWRQEPLDSGRGVRTSGGRSSGSADPGGFQLQLERDDQHGPRLAPGSGGWQSSAENATGPPTAALDGLAEPLRNETCIQRQGLSDQLRDLEGQLANLGMARVISNLQHSLNLGVAIFEPEFSATAAAYSNADEFMSRPLREGPLEELLSDPLYGKEVQDQRCQALRQQVAGLEARAAELASWPGQQTDAFPKQGDVVSASPFGGSSETALLTHTRVLEEALAEALGDAAVKTESALQNLARRGRFTAVEGRGVTPSCSLSDAGAKPDAHALRGYAFNASGRLAAADGGVSVKSDVDVEKACGASGGDPEPNGAPRSRAREKLDEERVTGIVGEVGKPYAPTPRRGSESEEAELRKRVRELEKQVRELQDQAIDATYARGTASRLIQDLEREVAQAEAEVAQAEAGSLTEEGAADSAAGPSARESAEEELEAAAVAKIRRRFSAVCSRLATVAGAHGSSLEELRSQLDEAASGRWFHEERLAAAQQQLQAREAEAGQFNDLFGRISSMGASLLEAARGQELQAEAGAAFEAEVGAQRGEFAARLQLKGCCARAESNATREAREEHQEAVSRCEQLREQRAALSRQVADHEADTRNLTAEMAAADGHRTNLEQQLLDREADNRRLGADIVAHREQCAKHTQQLAELEADKRRLGAEATESCAQGAALAYQLADQDAERRRLEAKTAAFREQCAELTQQLAARDADQRRHSGDASSLRLQCEALREQLLDASADRRRREAENAALQEQIRQLKEQLAFEVTSTRRRTAEMSEVLARCGELEARFEDMLAQNELLGRQRHEALVLVRELEAQAAAKADTEEVRDVDHAASQERLRKEVARLEHELAEVSALWALQGHRIADMQAATEEQGAEVAQGHQVEEPPQVPGVGGRLLHELQEAVPAALSQTDDVGEASARVGRAVDRHDRGAGAEDEGGEHHQRGTESPTHLSCLYGGSQWSLAPAPKSKMSLFYAGDSSLELGRKSANPASRSDGHDSCQPEAKSASTRSARANGDSGTSTNPVCEEAALEVGEGLRARRSLDRHEVVEGAATAQPAPQADCRAMPSIADSLQGVHGALRHADYDDASARSKRMTLFYGGASDLPLAARRPVEWLLLGSFALRTAHENDHETQAFVACSVSPQLFAVFSVWRAGARTATAIRHHGLALGRWTIADDRRFFVAAASVLALVRLILGAWRSALHQNPHRGRGSALVPAAPPATQPQSLPVSVPALPPGKGTPWQLAVALAAWQDWAFGSALEVRLAQELVDARAQAAMRCWRAGLSWAALKGQSCRRDTVAAWRETALAQRHTRELAALRATLASEPHNLPTSTSQSPPAEALAAPRASALPWKTPAGNDADWLLAAALAAWRDWAFGSALELQLSQELMDARARAAGRAWQAGLFFAALKARCFEFEVLVAWREAALLYRHERDVAGLAAALAAALEEAEAALAALQELQRPRAAAEEASAAPPQGLSIAPLRRRSKNLLPAKAFTAW